MAKTQKRKSFIFNIEWQEVLLEYPAEVRLEVYDAIIEYVASGTLLELKPMARIAFSFIKKEIDFNEQKYQEVCTKRSEAGKRGMESRYKEKVTNPTNDNKTNKSYQKVTNVTDNEYEYDNDIKKENNSNELFEKENNSSLFPVTQQQAPKKTTAKKFVKPTIQQVQAYCKERNNGINAEQFIDHYESKGWVVGKSPMKDWKAAVRTWERGRNTTSASEQSGANVPTGVTLGIGEYIDKTGKRTYGPGKANIPMNAPPRPSGQYTWSVETSKWVIL